MRSHPSLRAAVIAHHPGQQVWCPAARSRSIHYSGGSLSARCRNQRDPAPTPADRRCTPTAPPEPRRTRWVPCRAHGRRSWRTIRGEHGQSPASAACSRRRPGPRRATGPPAAPGCRRPARSPAGERPRPPAAPARSGRPSRQTVGRGGCRSAALAVLSETPARRATSRAVGHCPGPVICSRATANARSPAGGGDPSAWVPSSSISRKVARPSVRNRPTVTFVRSAVAAPRHRGTTHRDTAAPTPAGSPPATAPTPPAHPAGFPPHRSPPTRSHPPDAATTTTEHAATPAPPHHGARPRSADPDGSNRAPDSGPPRSTTADTTNRPGPPRCAARARP